MIAAIDLALSLSDETTVIVPAHGPLATTERLRAYREMLRTVRDRVAAGMALGQTLDQIQAANPTLGFQLGDEPESFVAAIFDSLTGTPPTTAE